MPYSFTNKLLDAYFSIFRNGGKSSFRAYCILMRGIKFSPNEEFVNKILSTITKQIPIHKKLLMGRPIRDKALPKFNLKFSDIDRILEALLYLETKISTSLMYSLCEFIEDIELQKYLKSLFLSYFNVIKTGSISNLRNRSVANQLKYLKANLPHISNRKVLDYGPRMTTNSNVWGTSLPFFIKSIPMGGKNKKY
ncbi:MAG: hypothetical protein K2H47_09515 [Muribaculaceae bacterium]|nr:hypothetical protein [Muribaculaceae bacterium]